MKNTYLIIGSLLALMSCTPTATSKKDETPKDPASEVASSGEDPLAQYAWHLENTGQSTFTTSSGTAGQDLKIKAVHESGIKGLGVKIAISDTGVEINHPDLSANALAGQHRDYSTDTSSNWPDGNPYPIEKEAHGTAVAGLTAAAGWNGIGSRGVAPLAKYAGFLFIGDFHNSTSSYQAKTLDQMTGNFDIFNYSYGYLGCQFYPATTSVIAAYKSGVTSLRSGKGAIYVKAAGNDYIGYNSDCTPSDTSSYLGNTNTDEEQNHPYLILAAAVNAKGKISSYSTPGSGVWISAAGGEYGDDSPAMLSTDITGCTDGISVASSTKSAFNKGANPLNSLCNYTSAMNGTSSATPVLSGVIALMLEANPSLTWRDVKHILAVTADKINFSTAAISHPGGSTWALPSHVYDYAYVTNFAGISFSNTFGFGRANANNAVAMAKTYSSTLGTYLESAYTNSAALNLAIPDKSATGVTDTINVSTAYIIESVQIKISTDHTYVGDLGVEVTSPLGTKSKILLVNSNIKHSGLSDYTLLTNAFYGENSGGNWVIKVVDGATSDTGNLTSWKVKINGHAP